MNYSMLWEVFHDRWLTGLVLPKACEQTEVFIVADLWTVSLEGQAEGYFSHHILLFQGIPLEAECSIFLEVLNSCACKTSLSKTNNQATNN